ncbi:MAG: hypothetical protein WCG47_34060 [Dermatophilaceae bacterium]
MTTAITSVGVSEAVPVGSATSSSTPVKKATSTTQAPTVQQPKTTRTSVRKRTTAVKTSTGSSGNVAATTALPAAMVNRRTAKLHNLNSTRLQALVESLNQSSDMRLQLQTLCKNVNSKHPMCQLQAI